MSICRPTCLLGLMSLMFAAPVAAQIVPDSSVGTTVIPNIEIKGVRGDRIDGGAIRGANLFHSFSEFNIQNGRGAYFTNPEGITNIFSRITGNTPSNINGILGVLGNANLFLLNPNGIIFGPNARLDLNGSFIGTTASSIRFADGVVFSATNATTGIPLLTVSVPIGLQFGQNPGAITVEGPRYRLINEFFIPIDRSYNPTGLKVAADNTLALIGGEVNFSGGIAAVDGGGHLEIGSVRNGEVKLNSTEQGWVGDYSAMQQFNDINLAQQSMLDASGSGGSIQLQGRNINFRDASIALIQNLGTQMSGGITVTATESLNLTGNTPDGRASSLIAIDNLGLSRMGDIIISAGQISLQQGGKIASQTFTGNPGGNIIIDVANSIDVDGFALNNPIFLSAIFTGTFNSGKSGNVTVSTGKLRFFNGGNLTALTIGSGEAGTLRVNAKDSIEIVGQNPITLSPSSMASTTVSSGNASNTFINTSRLVIRDGGFVGSGASATGSAGSVTINATELIEISGKTPGSILPSRIGATSEIVDQATQAAFGLPPIPKGDSGSVTIYTPALRITDDAFVTVKNDGPGKAGDLQVNANNIYLEDRGGITASTASGNGGNIRLTSQESLLMRHNSLISVTAAGKGDGGNLSINTPAIVGLENSDIIANAVQGNGGRINITTSGMFGLENRPQLTPFSDISASSQFGVSGTINVSVLNVNQQNVVPPPASNFVSPDQVVANSCLARSANSQGTLAIAGNGGLPETPETGILPYEVVQVQSASTGSASSNFQPSQVTSWKWGDPIVEATEFSVNAQGQVVLTAKGNAATAIPQSGYASGTLTRTPFGRIAQPQPIPCQPN